MTPSPTAPTGSSATWCPARAGQDHTTITDAGHFLQEDKGEDLAAGVIDFVHANTAP